MLHNKQVGDLVTTVPCVLHSDAGPCTKTRSANIVSWSSLVGRGPEKTSKLQVYTNLKSNNLGDPVAWNHLLKDFDALATGHANVSATGHADVSGGLGLVRLRLRALNVQWPFSQLLMLGLKRKEARKYAFGQSWYQRG